MLISRRLHRQINRPYAFGFMMTALAVVHAAPALAQDASPATPAAEDQQQADVVVTGSRVARSGYQSPTPLTVITQADIQNGSPTNNLADFVNELPAVAGSTRPSNSRLSISSGTAGINTVNLRNLGEVRTLVLLDGRRSVGSTVTGLVDVNTFPQALVKSVEVVTGGASAQYGSDAVAGVVNFILDKKYEGLKVEADSGITTYGDDGNYSASIAGGKSFADGRGHVLFSAEYAHRDGVFQVTRPWNQLGYRTVTNPNYTATNGQPQNLVFFGSGTSNALPGGIINSPGALKGIYFGPGGSVNHFNYGSVNSSSLTVGGDWALADNSRNIGLDPSDDRRGVFGRVSFEVAPWIELFAEASYNWQKSLFNAGPQLISAVSLKPDNAFLINALGAGALAGVSSVSLGTTANDLPYRKSNNERDVQRYVFGGDGEFQMFGKKAVWSAYAQYGETNTHEQLRDVMNSAAIANATDAVFAPAGNALGVPAGTIVCRSSLTAPTNGCQPLDFLGTGVASKAAIGYVLGNPYRNQKFQQTVAGVNLSTTPFATWAGDVSVAVGGEYRREEVSGYVPTQYQGGWSVGNFLPTFGSYDVKEAYLETVVPLGLGIEFNGAVRGTDYSTSGYVTTWKAGATWQPIPDIRLRVTQSRDIRAPNLNDLYQAGTSNSDTVTDRRDPNNIIQGETYRAIVTGNPDLKPEKADSTSVGAVFQPRFVPGLSVSVDWFQIKIKDAINSYGAQDIIDLCAEGHKEFCAAIEPDPSGIRTLLFHTAPFNFSKQTSRGIDFDASYRIPIERILPKAGGSLVLHGLATRYLVNKLDSGIPNVAVINTVGQNGDSGTPKWIYRASLTYDTPTYSITAIGRGVSAGNYANNYIECQTNCPASTTQFPTIDDNHVSGAFYADLNLTAKLGDTRFGHAETFINISNLFNQSPILLPEGGLSANTTYSDLLGRTFRVGVRFELR